MPSEASQNVLKQLQSTYSHPIVPPSSLGSSDSEKDNDQEDIDYYLKMSLGKEVGKSVFGKEKNTEERAIQKYVPKKEQRSIAENVVSTAMGIADFLENFQRGQYAVEGAIVKKLEELKSGKPEALYQGLTTGQLEAAKKGFLLEEKKTGRDIFKALGSEDFYNWIEKNTNIKLFNIGGDVVYDINETPAGMTKDEFVNLLKAKEGLMSATTGLSQPPEKKELSYYDPIQNKKIKYGRDVKGGITFDADALSIPAFMLDVVLDPLTYIPFGAPMKALSIMKDKFPEVFSKFASVLEKGLESSPKLMNVLKRTESAVDSAIKGIDNSKPVRIMSDKIDKVLPAEKIKNIQDVAKAQYTKFFDKRSGWKFEFGGGMQDLRYMYDIKRKEIQKIKNTDYIEDQVKGLITVGEKEVKDTKFSELFLNDKRIFMDKKQGEEAFKIFQQANDELIDLIDAKRAKEIGVSVEQLYKLEGLDNAVKGFHLMEMEDASEAARVLKELEDSILPKVVGDRKDQISKIVKNIKEDKGLRLLANGMANQEKKASIEFLNAKTKINLEANKMALAEVNAKKMGLAKALKNDVESAVKIYGDEFDTTFKKVKILNQNVDKLFKSEVGVDEKLLKQFSEKTNETISVLKAHEKKRAFIFKNLSKEAKESLIKSKPEQAFNVLKNQTQKLNSLFEKANIYGLKDLKGEFKGVLTEYDQALKGLNAIKKTEMSAIKQQAKTNISELKGVVGDKFKGFRESLNETIRTEKDLIKGMNLIQKKHAYDLAKIEKTSQVMANRYYGGFRELKKGTARQKIMLSMKKEADDLFEKHISDLPEGMQKSMKAIRSYLSDISQKEGAELGLIKGINLIYAPRKFEETFATKLKHTIDDVFRRGDRTFRAGLKRKFEKYAEAKAYMEAQGFKPIEDMRVLLYDYLQSFELKKSKTQLEKAVLARLNVAKKADLPEDIARHINILYKDLPNFVSNSPVMDLLGDAAGKIGRTYKMLLTLPNISFHSRNAMGFPFLAANTAGMKQGFNPKNFAEAFLLKTDKKGAIEVLENGKKKIYSYDGLREAMKKDGYFGTSYWRGEIGKNYKAAFNEYKKTDPRYWINRMYAGSTYLEDLGRTNAFVANLKNGHGVQESLNLARKAMFDYDMSNSAVDKAMQGILMWYSFSRRNLPRQVMGMLNDPKQYAMRSRLLQKLSNMNDLSDDEIKMLNESDRSTMQLYGQVIDGVREYRRLGFDPFEEFYGNIVGVMEKENIKEKFSRVLGKMNPLMTSFFDYVYDKDLYYGGKNQPYLHDGYTKIIPSAVQKAFGLEEKEVPDYKAGVKVGMKKVLTGNNDAIFLIRKFPFTRIAADAAQLARTSDWIGYLTGIKQKELDLSERQYFTTRQIKEGLKEKALEKGAKKFEGLFDPELSEKNKKNKKKKL